MNAIIALLLGLVSALGFRFWQENFYAGYFIFTGSLYLLFLVEHILERTKK